MNRWVVVAAIGVMTTSLYGGQQNDSYEQRKNDGNNPASQEARPEVKNRYHKRGDELLAEIESNMNAARQYSAPRDEHLAESIRAQVLDPSNKYDRIGVIVNRGHVSLWGEVPTQQDKNLIEGKVRQIKGVLSFNNQLTVAGHSGEGEEVELKDRYNSRGDEEIIKRIRDKLSSEPLWNQKLNVELDVYDGIVTVKGHMKGEELQHQVVEQIKSVQGVRGVNNHLQDR